MEKKTESTGKHIPIRTCVICRNKFPQNELERVTFPTKDTFIIDIGKKNIGRGYYFCHFPACQEKKKCFRPRCKVKNGAKKKE